MKKTHSSKDNSKGKVLKGEHTSNQTTTDKSELDDVAADEQGPYPEEAAEETPSQIRQRLYTEFRGKLENLAGELNSASTQLQGGGAQRLQRIAKDMTRSAKILK